MFIALCTTILSALLSSLKVQFQEEDKAAFLILSNFKKQSVIITL